jgi:3-deoxy-manno-octulosonate cytidylyltransferase (CMP-KDO synthetase)
MTIKSVGLIPCRIASTRLKNKIVKKIGDYPMFAHTYFKSTQSNLDSVYVCTGDIEIINQCKELNINYIKTNRKHTNGTERCYEAAKILNLKKNDVIINIQGDEPLVKKENLNLLLEKFRHNSLANLATLHKHQISLKNHNDTKLVINSKHKVMYISRSDIPFSNETIKKLIHIGIFCYDFKTLSDILNFKKTRLEKTENIELLRFLENDKNVFSYAVKNKLVGVDTLKEFNEAKNIIENDKKYLNSINVFYS